MKNRIPTRDADGVSSVGKISGDAAALVAAGVDSGCDRAGLDGVDDVRRFERVEGARGPGVVGEAKISFGQRPCGRQAGAALELVLQRVTQACAYALEERGVVYGRQTAFVGCSPDGPAAVAGEHDLVSGEDLVAELCAMIDQPLVRMHDGEGVCSDGGASLLYLAMGGDPCLLEEELELLI